MHELAHELYKQTGSRVKVAKTLRLPIGTVKYWASKFRWKPSPEPSPASPSVSIEKPSPEPSPTPTLFWCKTIDKESAHLVDLTTQLAACGAKKPLFAAWVSDPEPQRKCTRCMPHEVSR